MADTILVRNVEMEDIDLVAHHRLTMFRVMGRTTPQIEEPLRVATCEFLRRAIPSGEYVGWLGAPAAEPGNIVSGAGVQRRVVLPFPWYRQDGSAFVASGTQAIVINVYTEPAYRRQGYARRLMEEVIHWARRTKQESLVLHAARDGRALYEQLGFAPTTEMRFQGDLYTGETAP